MLDNKHGQVSRADPAAVSASRSPRAGALGGAARRGAVAVVGPGTLGRTAARVGLGDTARARHLVGQRLGLGIGGNPELALEGLGAALILTQRLAAPPGARIGAHQSALAKLGERVERHQPAAGLDGGIALAGGILRRGQPLQDVANQGERAVALGRQPFLKGLRIDVKIGQEFAAVQIGRSLQLGSVLRARQSLEAVEVDSHVLNATIGKIGDQIACPARPERLAQLQQAVAQTVARLFGALVGPQ